MRYSEYEKQLTRLEAAIAAERAAEARAAAGQGNWLDRMMPSRFQAKVEKAGNKRAALLRERTRLTRDFFGGPSLVRNVDMAAALHRTISAEGISSNNCGNEKIRRPATNGAVVPIAGV